MAVCSDGDTRTSGAAEHAKPTSAFLTLILPIKKISMKRKKTNRTDVSTPRCTPMPSTIRPAVSAMTAGNPPISSVNSRTSRVVPGMGVTIDAERFAIDHGQNMANKYYDYLEI